MQHFNLIVAGKNHAELVKPYDLNIETEPYLVHRFKDAETLRKMNLAYLEDLKKSDNPKLVQYAEERINEINGMSLIDYYEDLTYDCELDEKGDAYSTKNPKGKYLSAIVAKMYAEPMILKDGTTSMSALKKDIDWDATQNYRRHEYETAWDTVMGIRAPANEEEEEIYKNMKPHKDYLYGFGTKENYVRSCTSFWGFAFLSKKTGWVQMDDEQCEQFEWVKNFYDRFIKKLPDNTLLTKYECMID